MPLRLHAALFFKKNLLNLKMHWPGHPEEGEEEEEEDERRRR